MVLTGHKHFNLLTNIIDYRIALAYACSWFLGDVTSSVGDGIEALSSNTPCQQQLRSSEDIARGMVKDHTLAGTVESSHKGYKEYHILPIPQSCIWAPCYTRTEKPQKV